MSLLQLSALLDFLEGHPELALGRYTRTKEGRDVARRMWEDCAKILNQISLDCGKKTAEQWRLFFNDFKYRMLKRRNTAKMEIKATGRCSSSYALTPLQKRLFSILSHDPNVNSKLSTRIIKRDEVGTVFKKTKIKKEKKLGTSISVMNVPHENEWQSQPSGSDDVEQEQPMNSDTHAASEPGDPLAELESDGSEPKRNTLLKPKVHRRRWRRRQGISCEPNPEEISMVNATATLQAMEQLSARATIEHAQATNQQAQAINRLAAALETIAERLKEPFRIVIENSNNNQCSNSS